MYATDTFAYSDGVLGTASAGVWHQVVGGLSVTIGQVTTDTSSVDSYAVYDTVAVTTSQVSEVVVTPGVGSGSIGGPTVRGSRDALTCYWARERANGTTIELAQMTAGAYSLLATYTAGSGTHTIRLEAVTNGANVNLTVKLDGTTVITHTDTTPLTGGYVGVLGYRSPGSETTLMDAWEGGDLAPPSGLPTFIDGDAIEWDDVSGTLAVTLGATPSDGQGLILAFTANDETEVEPTWPAGFVSIGESTTALETSVTYVAAKVASSESGATYSISTAGFGTGPHVLSMVRLGTIDTTNFITTLQKLNRINSYNAISGNNTRMVPIDAPITDHMALCIVNNGAAGTLASAEADGAWTVAFSGGTGASFAVYTTDTAPKVIGNRVLQLNSQFGSAILIVPGTGSVISGDLGDFHVDNAVDDFDFDVGYTDGNTLASHVGWEAHQISGTGVPTIDEHHDHHPGYVVDGSNVGSTFVNLATDLGTPDHWGRLTFFTDTEVIGSGSLTNTAGIMLRSNTSTAEATTDGYVVALQRYFNTGQAHIRIFRMDNAVRTQIASTADLNVTPGFDENIVHTIHGKIEGTVITGYLDGVEVVSYDTTGDGTIYSTGNHVGLTLERGRATTTSQPFIGSYRTGTFPSGQTPASISGVGSTSVTTSDVGQITTPTPASISGIGSTSIATSGVGQITVSNASGITDYRIEYRTTSGPGVWQLYSDGVDPTTGANVIGLTPNAFYDFRVSAVNATGPGAWSNIVTVQAGSDGAITLYLGDSTLAGMSLGDTTVTKAYLGDIQVFG